MSCRRGTPNQRFRHVGRANLEVGIKLFTVSLLKKLPELVVARDTVVGVHFGAFCVEQVFKLLLHESLLDEAEESLKRVNVMD